ncbi:hypothetical protein Micbo1qcDRAFT_229686 [Microdochium bolleyi]|uniref:P-loop containing nucleoside triphosphate hydrolase protein n=1 Tax=Microdochium bolleyi TaxID=196109 RepID=A0A136JIB9_9PEZI|nr:hypothetical protein Micbo1qcDRAFT_229686 [Microdochium bolleyi]
MSDSAPQPANKAVIVGISGASSSGKTTLARLLRDIFPSTFILHEDDFYKLESELPSKDGLLDWDSFDSLNTGDMAKALAYIREHGAFPPFVTSIEDKNSVGKCPVSDAKIAAMRAKVEAWLAPGQPGHRLLLEESSTSTSTTTTKPGLKICILDGFLLYSPEMSRAGILQLLDVRFFLLVSRARATQRREARDGYVTVEGFWSDPPGYVDKIVWPNYVEAHSWLFKNRDVDGAGKLDEAVLRENGILAQAGQGADVDMETTFEWVVETLMQQLEEVGSRR